MCTFSLAPETKQGSPAQLGSSVDSNTATTASSSVPAKKQTIPAPKWAQVTLTFLKTLLEKAVLYLYKFINICKNCSLMKKFIEAVREWKNNCVLKYHNG